MDRFIRNIIHKKQESIRIKDGAPRLEDLKEGVPTIRFVNTEGIVMYIKYKNSIFKTVFDHVHDLGGIEVEFSD